PDLTGSFPGQGRRRVMGVLLRGGQVVDPGAGLAGALDVRVRDGLVTEVRAGLAPEGDTVLDVTGRLVLPGLIDLHAHCFAGAADFGPRTDDVARSTGVTTWVDGGSTGAGNFEGMREWVLSRSRVRMFAFLNISAIGLTYLKIGELNHLAYADVDAAVGAARDHADLILGIKVRNQIEVVGEAGLEPLRRAVRAADAIGGRVMLHCTNPPRPLAELLALMRPGDIVSHFLHGRGHGILDGHGKVSKEIRAARERLRGRAWPAHHRAPPLHARAHAARGRSLVAPPGRLGLSPTPSRARTALAVGAAVLAMLIYASQFVLSRWSMQRTLSLWDLAALRFTAAGLLSLPIVIRHRPAGAVAVRRLVVLSIAAGAPYTLIMYAGLVVAPAAQGAVVITGVTPVVTAALAWLWFGERPWPARTAGLGLIVLGLALVGWPGI